MKSAVTIFLISLIFSTSLCAIEIYGHRGAAGLAPGNTLEAFRTAINLDVDVIDMDIGITKDGVVVVHHDLSTAAEYFDKLILIKQRMYAYGTPQVVLNEELLSEVYEGRLRIFSDIIKKGES